MTINEFYREWINNLRGDAAQNNTDTEDEFLSWALELLENIGELDEPFQLYFGKQGRSRRWMGMNAYSFNAVDASLSIIISDFSDSLSPEALKKDTIDTLSRRMIFLLEEICYGNIADYADDSDEIIPFSRVVKNSLISNNPDVLKIRLYILTNAPLGVRDKKYSVEAFHGIPVELNLWYQERFFDLVQSSSNEPITIDIPEDFGFEGIPCLRGNFGSALEYDAYIAIIPGKLLASMYIEHGSRLLEGNVRAFLGARGSKSVNSGIRRTLIKKDKDTGEFVDSCRFFTYNNGIATTCSRVTLCEKNGQLLITGFEDLQIINGGQTTATLASVVLKKENTELEGVFVPMKLTVIPDRVTRDADGNLKYDVMVQNISRYANNQNPVKASDFFSNSPFHVRMEQLSKRHSAPPVGDSIVPTTWYYERSRGKYDQEQVKMTEGEKKRFQERYPRKQVITKEKLAKYLNAQRQMPHIVSRGANKNMMAFAERIAVEYAQKPENFNEFFFKKCVVCAIIYNEVDDYVKKAPWYEKGGYKLNIVPYTVSKLFSVIPSGKSIDWNRIWQKQTMYPSMVREVERISIEVDRYIRSASGNQIVTEFCKSEKAWEGFKALPYTPEQPFLDDLIDKGMVDDQAKASQKEQRTQTEIQVEIEVYNLGLEYWTKLKAIGDKNGLLSFKDRSLLDVAINAYSSGRLATTKQSRAILAIRDRLVEAGIVI